jgi:hypothetical protein
MLNNLLFRAALAAILALAACKTPAPQPPPMSWRVATAHLEDIFEQIPNSSIEDFRKESSTAAPRSPRADSTLPLR